jgi:hypothetical protein
MSYKKFWHIQDGILFRKLLNSSIPFPLNFMNFERTLSAMSRSNRRANRVSESVSTKTWKMDIKIWSNIIFKLPSYPSNRQLPAYERTKCLQISKCPPRTSILDSLHVDALWNRRQALQRISLLEAVQVSHRGGQNRMHLKKFVFKTSNLN